MAAETYVVGVDFGTLSGRAVVVRLSDGAELASAVHPFPHGVMDDVLAETAPCAPSPIAGLRVPHDLGVVGVDDIPEAAVFTPPLTTLRADFAALGQRSFGRPGRQGSGGRERRPASGADGAPVDRTRAGVSAGEDA